MKTMKRVFLITPFRGTPSAGQGPLSLVEENKRFARACMLDCFGRGESAFPPHLLFTQVCDDTNPIERELGMAAGRAWLASAEAAVCYVDLEVSDGMRRDIRTAMEMGVRVDFRALMGPAPTDLWLHENDVPHFRCPLCNLPWTEGGPPDPGAIKGPRADLRTACKTCLGERRVPWVTLPGGAIRMGQWSVCPDCSSAPPPDASPPTAKDPPPPTT
jgi:hypothetical protein